MLSPQAVLPASASDKGRSVITVKVDEEGADNRSFAIAALKLEVTDSQSLDLVFDAGETITFTVSGKNSVHLSGYHIPPSGSEGDGNFPSHPTSQFFPFLNILSHCICLFISTFRVRLRLRRIGL